MCTHLEECWTGFFFSFFFTFFFFIHSLFLGPLVEMGPRHVPRMPMPRSGPEREANHCRHTYWIPSLKSITRALLQKRNRSIISVKGCSTCVRSTMTLKWDYFRFLSKISLISPISIILFFLEEQAGYSNKLATYLNKLASFRNDLASYLNKLAFCPDELAGCSNVWYFFIFFGSIQATPWLLLTPEMDL